MTDPARRWWPLGQHEIVIELRDPGCFVVVDTRNLDTLPIFAKHGTWEPNVSALVKHLLKPGDVYVGGGACFGYYPVLAAKAVGAAGKVIAFEANPWLAEKAMRSCAWSECLDRVRLHCCAVGPPGSHREMVLCFSPEHAAGGSNDYGVVHPPEASDLLAAIDARSWSARLSECFSGEHGLFTIPMRDMYYRQKVTTIDALVPDGEVRVLHVDVEDWSHPAILGAEKLIARSPWLSIIAEFAEMQAGTEVGARVSEAWTMLRSLGFEACHIANMNHERGLPNLISIPTIEDFLHPKHNFANILWSRP